VNLPKKEGGWGEELTGKGLKEDESAARSRHHRANKGIVAEVTAEELTARSRHYYASRSSPVAEPAAAEPA
jgi:hypothetical protein